MARSDRLFLLLQALRRLPAPVTAARLADETGVSLRSLYRDIASLRAGGALIDGAAGVGYTLTEDPALPPQMFTRLEVEALVLGLAEVGQMGDPALRHAAEDALAKVVATLPERVARQALHATAMVYRYEPRPAAPACLAILRAAAWEERAVNIAYADMAGVPTNRQIWPLAIAFLDRTLVCLAWCCLRQDFRRFRLDRIAQATPTAARFYPRRVALLRQYRDRLSGRT
jgi:predicted DNA-binding transcriptional regulator YafY